MAKCTIKTDMETNTYDFGGALELIKLVEDALRGDADCSSVKQAEHVCRVLRALDPKGYPEQFILCKE